MNRGPLLSPEQINYQQRVIVVPCDDVTSRGHGLGCFAPEGHEAVISDSLLAQARRGAVHLYALPTPDPRGGPLPTDETPPSGEPVKE